MLDLKSKINQAQFQAHKKLPISSLSWKNLKPVFVREYTKTGKSILRPAFDQSNCKKACPALKLIERHLIKLIINYGNKIEEKLWFGILHYADQ